MRSSVITMEARFSLLPTAGTVLLWMVVLFAVVSGTQYFWDFRRKMDARLKQRTTGHLVVIPGGKEKEGEKDVAAH